MPAKYLLLREPFLAISISSRRKVHFLICFGEFFCLNICLPSYSYVRKALIVPWRNRSYRILYRLSPALHCYMLKLSFPPSWNNHSGWVIMSCLLEALVVALPAEIRFEMWLWMQDSGTAMDLQHRLTPHALPPIKICWPHHSVMACGYKLFPLRLHVRITEPNLRFSSYQAQRGGWKSLPQIRRNTSCARLWA